MDWIEIVARFLSFWLDKIIYSFIPTIYNLLTEIAETTIFSSDIVDMFASKIYALLGIFMLFKVSFSILTYIVDPDAFLDKSKGFGKLISNIIITLVLLVLVPWIFKQAMDLQSIILKDNIIESFFSVTDINSNSTGDPGNKMAYETFKAFYYIDTNLFSECASGEGAALANPEGCKNKLGLDDDDWTTFQDTLNYAYNTNSVSIYMNYDLLNLKAQNDEYVMNYKPIISTLCGGVILLLLIVFCFDVAVRSVKLGFLNLIAPVPIISRVDPKNGKETFDKWVKTCISTYLDLFIRLLAIYFAVFVISQVIDLKFVSMTTGSDKNVDSFVKIFIILGALMFAKQFPKLIEDITGVKMDGNFTLNPLKKLNQTGVPGLAAIGAAGALGFAANAMEAKGANGRNPSVLRRISSGFGGMGSSMYNTGRNVIKNKGDKNFDSLRNGVSASSNNRRMREGGYGFTAKLQDSWTDMSGHKFNTGTSSMLKNDINNLEIDLQNIKQSEGAARKTFYESLNGTSSAVRDYFDFSFEKTADGKFDKYVEKSLDDFLSTNNISRSSLSHEEITTFENMLANYNSVISLDSKGRSIEKQIKDKKEQMENSRKKNG